MTKPNILIVGAGFAGIKAALELCDSDRFNVTLVSNTPDFRYYPALYRSATGGARKISAIPLTEIFNRHNIKIITGTAVGLDRQHKKLELQGGQKIGYDTLLLNLGMVTNYFGIKGLDKYSYGIKSIEEAEGLKLHLHQQLITTNKPDLHYIVIGAGPTGVELAGALPHYIKHIMREHGMKPRRVEVELVEAAPRVMPRMPKDVSKRITKHLRSIGVDVHVNQKVEAETADALLVNGKPIESHTVVWTAGVMNNPFFADNNFVMTEHHKVHVDSYLKAEDDIYVLGDNADTPYSGMAQTALYDAKFVVNNLIRQERGKRLKAYVPKQPIYVTPAGPRWAAVLWGNVRIYGWLGWMLRRAADLIAYHDYQPWWQASQLMQAERIEEEQCPLCSPNK